MGANISRRLMRAGHSCVVYDKSAEAVSGLAGKGATARMMVRVFIPALLIMVPFWFIPTTVDVHLSMTLPILIPFVFFSHALNKVWRRHMLRLHGLDPALADALKRQKDAHIHDAYIAKYGPRSGPSSSHDV